jgi:hypothetical protein
MLNQGIAGIRLSMSPQESLNEFLLGVLVPPMAGLVVRGQFLGSGVEGRRATDVARPVSSFPFLRGFAR